MKADNSSLFTPQLAFFLTGMILANTAGAMYKPLLALYLQSTGAGIEMVGLFFTLSLLFPLVLSIFGGWVSDFLGRLKAIAFGSLAGIVSYLIFTFVPHWEWMILATGFDALAFSLVNPSFQAYLAESSDENRRGRLFGLSRGIFMLVGVIGPPLGGYLSQFFGYHAMFLVATGLYCSAAIIRIWMAIHFPIQKDSVSERFSSVSIKKSLVDLGQLLHGKYMLSFIALSLLARDGIWNLVSKIQPLYLQEAGGFNNAEIGWMFSITALVNMALMAPAGWLSDMKGERPVVLTGLSAMIAGLLLLALSDQAAGFVAATIFLGLGSAFMIPAFDSLFSKIIPDRMRGIVLGMFATITGMLSIPLPYLGSLLWYRISPVTPFYVTAGLAVLIVPVLAALLPASSTRLQDRPGQ